MEVNNYASKGAAATGITLGATGLGVAALNAMAPGGLLSGLLGGGCNRGCNRGCGDGAAVNRYELGLEQSNAAKDSRISLLESTIHTNDKILEVYGYMDGRLRNIESQLCQQAVINSEVRANLGCMQTAISGLQALTKTVVPIGNICPEPAPLYNSWVAPTTTTTP